MRGLVILITVAFICAPTLAYSSSAPPEASDLLSEAASLWVSRIELEGATALDAQQVRELLGAYENRRVSMEELQGVRQALTRMYVDAGFINSGVTLPDQRIEDGVVRFVAVEGTLSRIDVTGSPGLTAAYLSDRVQQHVNGPLNVEDLQYALRWLQRDPLVDRIDAELLPGDERGDSVLRLGVAEPERVTLAVSGDNHNSASVGEFRTRFSATVNNVTGRGDKFSGNVSISEGAEEGGASYTLPLNSRNRLLSVYYGRSDAEIVEDAFSALDIESVTTTLGVSLSEPLIDDLTHSLVLTAGLETKHSESELLGLPYSLSPGSVDGDSDTTSWLASLEYGHRGSDHIATIRGTYRQGIDINGSSQYDPRGSQALVNPTGADGDFELWLLQGTFIHRLNAVPGLRNMDGRAQFVARVTAQLSDDPLMSLEKIAIGGVNSVRGYEENLLVRDNGVAASAEVQLPIPGYVATPSVRNLVVSLFIDYGRSWDELDVDPISTDRDTSDFRYLLSAGVGLHWQPLEGLRANLLWGAEIDDNFDGDDPRDFDRDSSWQESGFHVSLSYQRSFW